MAKLREQFQRSSEVRDQSFTAPWWRRFLRPFTRKGFTVDLDDVHSFPMTHGFVMANTADILAAIDHYCEKNHHQATYLSTDPVIFRLDGKETYQAELSLVRPRFTSVYLIHCFEISE